ncbi:MAG TPA: FHA domain-containing protein [Solirubrobacteraceae bacterium]|jgi:predicted  nucleic acid-binding Zn-ribbon protein|nr:FHA domain-containing protein [Solirubrobacteraceae bacterium]
MVESLTSGTMAGAGSFRCQRCGYVLTLAASDTLSDCPGCGGASFVRASLFSVGRLAQSSAPDLAGAGAHSPEGAGEGDPGWLAYAREQIEHPGEYLAYEEDGETALVALTQEWTRVGRSLAADVRFDDPTVSRRHALLVRQPDGVRVLDDRSLNGVFVNGERIEWRMLVDGDEIVVGRYRLHFFSVPGQRADRGPAGEGQAIVGRSRISGIA